MAIADKDMINRNWRIATGIIRQLGERMEKRQADEDFSYKEDHLDRIVDLLVDTGFARVCEDCGLLIQQGYYFGDEPTCEDCARKYAEDLSKRDDLNCYDHIVLQVMGLEEVEDEDELDEQDTCFYTEWEGEF